jgi:putative copper export protein
MMTVAVPRVEGLHVLAAMVLFGSTLFPLYAPTGRFLDRPLRRIVRAAAVLALLSTVVWMVGMLAATSRDTANPANWNAAAASLLESGTGGIWLLHLALLAMALLVSMSLRRNSWTARPQARVLAALAAAILISQTFIARAGGAQDVTAAVVLLRAVFCLAAGALMGGLAAIALMVSNAKRSADPQVIANAHSALRRFSLMATVAIVSIVLSQIGILHAG